MKLATNWKTIAPVTGVAALLLWGIAGQSSSDGAGSLTPPEGEPEPTMPTLKEIGYKVDTLGSSGKNFAFRYSTRVEVWNSETGTIAPAHTVTGLVSVVESDGNFAALGNARGSAWNKKTGTWSTVTNIPGASNLVRANGNFCIVGTSKAAAWSRMTGTWSERTISNPGSVEVSNGNFLIRGGSRIYIWSERTGNWLEHTPQTGLIGVISAGN